MNTFEVVCAIQLGGSLGMQLWGLAAGSGRLFSTFQKLRNGPWEKWSECSEAPPDLVNFTAAQNSQGEVSLWAVDRQKGVLHCASQTSVGVDNWVWSDAKLGWWPVLPSERNDQFLQWTICACEPSYKGASGRQLWSYSVNGSLYSTYEQQRLGGNWVPWKTWDVQPLSPRDKLDEVFALTAAQNGQGEVSLWALDSKGVLHCRSQIKAGEAWDPWVKGWSPVPAVGTPADFFHICACKQAGSLGRALWGVGYNGKLYWTYEQVATGGGWTKWEEFPGPEEPVKFLTAVRRQDGRVALWACSKSNVLYNNIQKAAGGKKWAKWELGGTRQENFGVLDEIETTLARSPGNERVTYLRTSGSKFTLLDTPRLWGQGPTATGRGSEACNKLLNAITNVIGSATQILDITLLYNPDPAWSAKPFPDGDFQKAISEGFKTLIKYGRKPGIRILLGVPVGGFWRKFWPRPATYTGFLEYEQEWLRATIDLGKLGCPLFLAHDRSKSWNHTKIIVADDKLAITGGHNFYDKDYLEAAPVHDVSGVFEGPAARAARKFCDKLWTQTSPGLSLIDGVLTGYKGGPPPNRQMPILNGGPPGHLEMLSLGRLGKGLANFSISSNASVTARIVAFCKAKNAIRISQQSLRGIFPGPPLYDLSTCLAIVRAVRAGVTVQIVLSGETRFGYEGKAKRVLQCLQMFYLLDVLPPDSIPLPKRNPNSNRRLSQVFHSIPERGQMDQWVDLMVRPDSVVDEGDLDFSLLAGKEVAIAQFNSKLKLATLYYSDNCQAANHSKVYIIDGDCFYVGSDNMYVSAHKEGLQEFGYLIEDENETQKFIAEYWNQLWQYSVKLPLN